MEPYGLRAGSVPRAMQNVKTWPENLNRFRELILYISQKCATDPKFNTIKLNKLMFFSDFFSYAIYGEPITGFEYLKLERGPAPKRMPEIKKAMQAEKILGLQELPLQDWRRTVNLRRPDLSVFKPEHISLVDSLIEKLEAADHDVISAVSHQMPCWIIPSLGQTIPYELVFLSDEKLTDADIERGKIVATELGLLEHHA